MAEAPEIVVVEDNPADAWLIRSAISQAGVEAQISVLDDGELAINYIEEADTQPARSRPSLLVLDLNLPRRSGHEVMMRWHSSRLSSVPILIITSSDSPRDRKAVQQFTGHYFHKPMDLEGFLKIGPLIRDLIKTP